MDVVFGRGQGRAEFTAETDISVRSRQWTLTLVCNEHLSMKAIQEVRIYTIYHSTKLCPCQNIRHLQLDTTDAK